MISFRAPTARSIAPPTLPPPRAGTNQLARSPVAETCNPPRTAASICPPRIIVKESAVSKKLAPATSSTGCPPALIRSESKLDSEIPEYPRMPFSAWNRMPSDGSTNPATNVGRPIPRLTTDPASNSRAARSAISSRLRPVGGVVDAMVSRPSAPGSVRTPPTGQRRCRACPPARPESRPPPRSPPPRRSPGPPPSP